MGSRSKGPQGRTKSVRTYRYGPRMRMTKAARRVWRNGEGKRKFGWRPAKAVR